MANNADGSVVIKVITDDSEAVKTLKALENRMSGSVDLADLSLD